MNIRHECTRGGVDGHRGECMKERGDEDGMGERGQRKERREG